MKVTHQMLCLILLGAGAGLASANSGVADRFNEARTYPVKTSSSQDANALCQQHARLHQTMSRSETFSEHDVATCMRKMMENAN